MLPIIAISTSVQIARKLDATASVLTQNNKLSELPEDLLARCSSVGTLNNIVPDEVSLCSGVERI
jgi:hypothetical protein